MLVSTNDDGHRPSQLSRLASTGQVDDIAMLSGVAKLGDVISDLAID